MDLENEALFKSSELRLTQHNLPLFKYRTQIIEGILKNQSMIIKASTGLGKTTQIPQYLFLDPYFHNYQIFCTQPRKIAASSISKRVNDEFGLSTISCSCLYSKDFPKLSEFPIIYFSESAFLNYLLTEIYNEIPLPSGRVLILDEAHERNVETDVILALIKKHILTKRKDFKLIVTSATLNTDVLSKYLGCPVLTCEGSTYPVREIFLQKSENYFAETVNMVVRVIQGKIAANGPNETILVFLAGYDEINNARLLVKKRVKMDEVEILMLYGNLDFTEQQEIVNTQRKRIRVVLSTNIAESSLTVQGVTCVIDSGREKLSVGYYKDFRVKFVTKMSAIQRKGRAGRTNPGTCYRIYTENEYAQMEEYRTPAILRSHLGLLALKFLKFGIFEFGSLPLLDSPDPELVRATYFELLGLNLIEHSEFNTHKLTNIGKFALDLDISPVISKFIFHAFTQFECGDEATMLSASLLCIDFLFLRYETIEEEKDFREHYLLYEKITELGDFISTLFIFRQYFALLCNSCLEFQEECTCATLRKNWCDKYFICEKKLKNAVFAYHELSQKLEVKFPNHVFYFSEEEWSQEKTLARMSLSGCFSAEFKGLLHEICECYKEFYEKYFESAIISGFYMNLAQYRGENIIDAGYLYLASQEIVVPHPCSHLGKLKYSDPPKYVIFFEISVTTNLFMKYISPVSLSKIKKICPKWLQTLKFSENLESISGLVFQNIGPFYMKELLGTNHNKLYDLESSLKSQGAYGLLILPDPQKNCLKIRLPQQFRPLGEELLRKVLSYKSSEALRKSTVNIPYSKGMILVVNPGGIISEIVYNDDSLVFCIGDLKNYSNYSEALMDIQNSFEFYQFNLKKNGNDSIGILYFKSQSQAEKAKISLKERPIIGKNGPISEMIPIEKRDSQPCLKVKAGLQTERLEQMLKYYGETRSLYIRETVSGSLAFVRYLDSTATDLCYREFNNWVKEDYGDTVFVSINKLQNGILIPKELVRVGLGLVNDYLTSICNVYGIDLNISGKKVLRIYGDFSNIPSEALDSIMDLVNYDTLPITLDLMRFIEKSSIPYFGNFIDWATWQEENLVFCNYLYYRSALAVYGPPQNRQNALIQIQQLLSVLLKQLFTTQIPFRSLKDFRKIELFKKNYSKTLQVEININRRKGNFLITGLKKHVENALNQLDIVEKFQFSDEVCGICLNHFQEAPISLSLCGHRFHSACLNFQIKASMSESGISGFPMNCIICEHPLVHNDWLKVLTYEELNSFLGASLVHFITNQPIFSHCENPNCDFVYNSEKSKENGNSRACPRCKGKFCVVCKKQIVGAGHEIQCELKNISEENMKWIQTNTAACPRCKIRIEKNKGCNHLVCIKCSCHFCFICKEEIVNYPVVDHYRQPEKICYQKYIIND